MMRWLISFVLAILITSVNILLLILIAKVMNFYVIFSLILLSVTYIVGYTLMLYNSLWPIRRDKYVVEFTYNISGDLMWRIVQNYSQVGNAFFSKREAKKKAKSLNNDRRKQNEKRRL